MQHSLFILLFLGFIGCFTSCMSSGSNMMLKTPPVVYTIAGSDSGGGAGIQADIHAIHAMGGHGCTAITCLTAQNSVGVTAVNTPPTSFLQMQLNALIDDLHPTGIKIGMLGTKEIVLLVRDVLKQIKEMKEKVWIVLDPVMISTSGSKLIDDDAIEAIVQNLFPLVDIVTPNKFEAECLLKTELRRPQDVERGARDLLKMGCNAVIIKGGHILSDEKDTSVELKATLAYALDYLLTNEECPVEGDERLCDGDKGVWLRTSRWDSEHTHGTGCTLSSAIATALALGEQNRNQNEPEKVGATSAIKLADACCLAKAYVSAGIKNSVQLGTGPGPVAQTGFPSQHDHFPTIATDPASDVKGFRPMKAHAPGDSNDDGIPMLGQILPIVDTVDWVQRLVQNTGISDIQLRIKDVTDPDKIVDRVVTCQELCEKNGVRLWVNDHWEAAVHAGCFGVHVGQEDLLRCMDAGGLEKLRLNNIALGISTHSYGELAAALGMKPSYISLGPIARTSSKKVGFAPQGLATLSTWRKLIPSSIPLVSIGGINDVAAAKANRESGSDCIAVISAITGNSGKENLSAKVSDLNDAMSSC